MPGATAVAGEPKAGAPRSSGGANCDGAGIGGSGWKGSSTGASERMSVGGVCGVDGVSCGNGSASTGSGG